METDERRAKFLIEKYLSLRGYHDPLAYADETWVVLGYIIERFNSNSITIIMAGGCVDKFFYRSDEEFFIQGHKGTHFTYFPSESD